MANILTPVPSNVAVDDGAKSLSIVWKHWFQLLQTTINTLVSPKPCFSAYQTVAQAVPFSTMTKVTFTTIDYNVTNAYNPALSRFTPKVAGYYFVTGYVQVAATTTTIVVHVYKNGGTYKSLIWSPGATVSGIGGGCMVQMNGTTDYVEIYTGIGAAQNLNIWSYFQATFIQPL